MDIDHRDGRSLSSLQKGVLRRILEYVPSGELVKLCATFDRKLLAMLSEPHMIDELHLPLPTVNVSKRPQRWDQLFLLKTVASVRMLLLTYKRDRLWSPEMVANFVRLDPHELILNHLPDCSSFPTRCLTKSRKALHLGFLFPHLRSLCLQGKFLDPIAVTDMLRSLPRTFQSFSTDWTFASYKAISLGKVLRQLPSSTTSVKIEQPPGNGGSGAPDAENFYTVQTLLPELTTLHIAYDSLIFDTASRNPTMPPHLWTPTLTDVNLRTDDLKDLVS